MLLFVAGFFCFRLGLALLAGLFYAVAGKFLLLAFVGLGLFGLFAWQKRCIGSCAAISGATLRKCVAGLRCVTKFETPVCVPPRRHGNCITACNSNAAGSRLQTTASICSNCARQSMANWHRSAIVCPPRLINPYVNRCGGITNRRMRPPCWLCATNCHVCDTALVSGSLGILSA